MIKCLFFYKYQNLRKKIFFWRGGGGGGGGWRGGREGGGLELVNFFTKSPNLK